MIVSITRERGPRKNTARQLGVQFNGGPSLQGKKKNRVWESEADNVSLWLGKGSGRGGGGRKERRGAHGGHWFGETGHSSQKR